MNHVILDLDEGCEPTKQELTMRVAPDDDTCFEIRDRPDGPLVGVGYAARLSAPNLLHLGAFPSLIERIFPEDDDAAEDVDSCADAGPLDDSDFDERIGPSTIPR